MLSVSHSSRLDFVLLVGCITTAWLLLPARASPQEQKAVRLSWNTHGIVRVTLSADCCGSAAAGSSPQALPPQSSGLVLTVEEVLTMVDRSPQQFLYRKPLAPWSWSAMAPPSNQSYYCWSATTSATILIPLEETGDTNDAEPHQDAAVAANTNRDVAACGSSPPHHSTRTVIVSLWEDWHEDDTDLGSQMSPRIHTRRLATLPRSKITTTNHHKNKKKALELVDSVANVELRYTCPPKQQPKDILLPSNWSSVSSESMILMSYQFGSLVLAMLFVWGIRRAVQTTRRPSMPDVLPPPTIRRFPRTIRFPEEDHDDDEEVEESRETCSSFEELEEDSSSNESKQEESLEEESSATEHSSSTDTTDDEEKETLHAEKQSQDFEDEEEQEAAVESTLLPVSTPTHAVMTSKECKQKATTDRNKYSVPESPNGDTSESEKRDHSDSHLRGLASLYSMSPEDKHDDLMAHEPPSCLPTTQQPLSTAVNHEMPEIPRIPARHAVDLARMEVPQTSYVGALHELQHSIMRQPEDSGDGAAITSTNPNVAQRETEQAKESFATREANVSLESWPTSTSPVKNVGYGMTQQSSSSSQWRRGDEILTQFSAASVGMGGEELPTQVEQETLVVRAVSKPGDDGPFDGSKDAIDSGQPVDQIFDKEFLPSKPLGEGVGDVNSHSRRHSEDFEAPNEIKPAVPCHAPEIERDVEIYVPAKASVGEPHGETSEKQDSKRPIGSTNSQLKRLRTRDDHGSTESYVSTLPPDSDQGSDNLITQLPSDSPSPMLQFYKESNFEEKPPVGTSPISPIENKGMTGPEKLPKQRKRLLEDPVGSMLISSTRDTKCSRLDAGETADDDNSSAPVEVLKVIYKPSPEKRRRKSRPFSASHIVPDWVPSRGLQVVSRTFMEESKWKMGSDGTIPSAKTDLSPIPRSINLPNSTRKCEPP